MIIIFCCQYYHYINVNNVNILIQLLYANHTRKGYYDQRVKERLQSIGIDRIKSFENSHTKDQVREWKQHEMSRRFIQPLLFITSLYFERFSLVHTVYIKIKSKYTWVRLLLMKIIIIDIINIINIICNRIFTICILMLDSITLQFAFFN